MSITSPQRVRLLLVVLFLFSLGFASFAYGQEQDAVTARQVSTVNVQEVAYVQKGHLFDIYFDVTNREGVQPGVKYGVILKQKTDTGEMVVDEYAEPEILTLGPGETLTRRILYTAPEVLEGTYVLYVVAKNSDGATFALNRTGEVSLERSIETWGAYIDLLSCYLTIDSNTDVQYKPYESFRISGTEDLNSHCIVENIGTEPLELMPRMETYRRSIFGDLVPTIIEDVEAVILAPGERREIVTALSYAGDPQKYVTRLTYGYGGNTIAYTYTVSGGAAAVQNIRFDKDSYNAGDTAQVLFDWAGSLTDLENPRVIVSFATKEGELCSDFHTYALAGTKHHEINVPINTACPEPDVSVTLTDDSSGSFTEYLYAIDKTPDNTTQSMTETEGRSMWVVYTLLGIAVVVFGALLIMFMIRRKKEDTMIPPIATLLFLGVAAYVSLLYVPQAEASSVAVTSQARMVYFTVSLDKAQYAPNEMITVTGEATLEFEEDCNDLGFPPGCTLDKSVRLIVEGQTILEGNLTTAQNTLTGSVQIPAAAVSGSHTLNLIARNQSLSETFEETYSVLAPVFACTGPTPSPTNGTRAADSTDNISLTEGNEWEYSASPTIAERCEFVCIDGYTWNASENACVEQGGDPGSGDPSDPGGSGGPVSITAEPCTIPVGGSTCTIPSSSGAGIFVSGAPSSARIFVRENAQDITPSLFSDANPPISASWVRPHIIFELYEGAVSQNGVSIPSGNRLGSVTNVAVCAGSSNWDANLNRCVDAPPDQSGTYISTCKQGTPGFYSGPQQLGDPGCPTIEAPDYTGIGDGFTLSWSRDSKTINARVLNRRTLSLEVHGLQPGAEMCRVFYIHPDSSRVPTPKIYKEQYCTFESNYETIEVSNGVAYIEIPQVAPEYEIDASYYLFFRNPGSDKAVKMHVSVTAFGTDGATLSPWTSYCSDGSGPDIGLYYGCGTSICTTDKPYNISLNPVGELVGAQWTIEALEFNKLPGDSVEFSRTGGQFDGDGSTSNPNNQTNIKVLGLPRTVGVKVTATTPQPICGARVFTSEVYTEDYYYPRDGESSFQCGEFLPEHARPWSPLEGSSSSEIDWQFSRSDTGRRCEFRCNETYMWDETQSACVINPSLADIDVFKWRVGGIPEYDFSVPQCQEIGVDVSNISNGSACTPELEHVICDDGDRRYRCRDVTTEYPAFSKGKVLDFEGRPVPDFVIANGDYPFTAAPDTRNYATTNSEGRYTIEGAGDIRIPNMSPYRDLEDPTPGYIYWSGGKILLDQVVIQNQEKIYPVTDMVVRKVQNATTTSGKSVVVADKPDLISIGLLVPGTGIKNAKLSLSAQVINNTTTATPSGFQDRFLYRWNNDTTWQELVPISREKLGSGESVTDKLSFLIPAAGELWIKHCVNTNNAFPEYNTENNCSEYTKPVIIADPASGLRWKKIVDLIEDEYTGSLPAQCIDAPIVDTACSVAMPSPCHIGDFIYTCE